MGFVRRARCRLQENQSVMTPEKTVLTVDDSRTMRDMLRLALAGSGYRVVQAVDGLDGLEVL